MKEIKYETNNIFDFMIRTWGTISFTFNNSITINNTYGTIKISNKIVETTLDNFNEMQILDFKTGISEELNSIKKTEYSFFNNIINKIKKFILNEK